MHPGLMLDWQLNFFARPCTPEHCAPFDQPKSLTCLFVPTAHRKSTRANMVALLAVSALLLGVAQAAVPQALQARAACNRDNCFRDVCRIDHPLRSLADISLYPGIRNSHPRKIGSSSQGLYLLFAEDGDALCSVSHGEIIRTECVG